MNKRTIDKRAFGQRLTDARSRAKLTQSELARLVGVTQQSIQGYEAGTVGRPGNIIELASAVRTTPEWLLWGDGKAPQPQAEQVAKNVSSQSDTAAHNARLGAKLDGFAKVPLRGQGMGGRDGALIFDDTNMGQVLAPPSLYDVPGAYAVYVVGDSMANRFRDGEVVYVHPYQRVVKGDDCVIQIEAPDGERLGWIKEFVSRDEKSLKVLQHNPKKILTFDCKSLASVHKIIMSGPA